MINNLDSARWTSIATQIKCKSIIKLIFDVGELNGSKKDRKQQVLLTAFMYFKRK